VGSRHFSPCWNGAAPAGAPAWFYGERELNLRGISEANMKKILITGGFTGRDPPAPGT